MYTWGVRLGIDDTIYTVTYDIYTINGKIRMSNDAWDDQRKLGSNGIL